MENEFAIDFSKLKIADSEYDREGEVSYYTARLEPDLDSEDTMRFQYEVMKRAGIEDDLQNAGIEVNDFEQFKQLYNDDAVMLKIEISYIDNNGNEGIVANALYGESSTHFTEVPLNATEKVSLEQFADTVLLEDKSKLISEYDNDKELE